MAPFNFLGGYYGSGIGRRGGTVSHFLLGMLRRSYPLTDASGVKKASNLYYSVARVGSGYTDNELKDLQKVINLCAHQLISAITAALEGI